MLSKVIVQIVFFYQRWLCLAVNNPPGNNHGKSSPEVLGVLKLEIIETHNYQQVEIQVKEHIVDDMLPYLTSTFEDLKVNEN